MFGGSSNCWGGWCKQFSEEDFEARDWLPNSGWPFHKNHLAPFYDRAEELLELKPAGYKPDVWLTHKNQANLQILPNTSSRVASQIAHLAPRRQLGRSYRDAIHSAGNVQVVLNANVGHIQAAASGQSIQSVSLQHLNGNRAKVKAKYFILACGGIENARLLLHSNDVQKDGLGNQNDVVGRYFMDHPRLEIGDIAITEPGFSNNFYDVNYGYFFSSAVGTLAMAPATMREKGIANAGFYLNSEYSNPEEESIKAFHKFTFSLHKRQYDDISFRDLFRLATSPVSVTKHVIGKIFRPESLLFSRRIMILFEPAPNPNSRITLSEETDRLGLRKPSLDWRLTDYDKNTILQSRRIVADEIKNAGIGQVSFDQPDDKFEFPPDITYCWHHMGTTRMHEDPKQGVVDQHCRVHGLENLFVAGSSVFPTASSDMPTLTIIALAMRLADHLKRLHETPRQPISSHATAK